jgi:zinc finger protein
MDVLEKEKCPMCNQDTLTLMEDEKEVPFFGKVYVYSMDCTNAECKYHKADVECAEQHEPVRYTIEVDSDKDMSIRIVKSSEATVKIPHITTITPGPASNGYVTNIEGVISRVKKAIETAREDAEDDEDKKKAKNMLKKLQRVMWGQEKLKIIIEDPSGNSAIISDKAVKESYKPAKAKAKE